MPTASSAKGVFKLEWQIKGEKAWAEEEERECHNEEKKIVPRSRCKMMGVLKLKKKST